jgi:predicted MPP superfamily phosphohydrolase
MVGYTSCGVGVSGIPVRFHSRGEVVHITLTKNHASSL